MTDIELVVKKGEEDRLYQWDTDRKIKITTDLMVDEVDFSNVLSNSAMVVTPSVDVELGGMVAQIPNLLLQNSMPVEVYVVMHTQNGKHVVERAMFDVIGRKRPDDYIYTETEVLSYEAPEKRVSELEQSGGAGGILKETDPTVPDWAKQPEKPTYTAEEVGALPEDTEIPDITELEDRVSELEKAGGTISSADWEKVAEIPMNTETVIYEFASMADYSEILVYIQRTYDGSSGTGVVEFRLEDENGNYKKLYSTSNGIKGKNSQVHVKVSGDVIETIGSGGNSISDTASYSVVIDEELASNGMFKLKMTESWAAIVKDGDTIAVYGKRRS